MLFSSFAKLCAKGAGIKNNPGDRVVGAQRGKSIFLSSGNGEDRRRVGTGEKNIAFFWSPLCEHCKVRKAKGGNILTVKSKNILSSIALFYFIIFRNVRNVL